MSFGISNRRSRLGPLATPEEIEWATEQDWLETKHRFNTDPGYRRVVYGHMARTIGTVAYEVRRAGESAKRSAEQMREALRVMQ